MRQAHLAAVKAYKLYRNVDCSALVGKAEGSRTKPILNASDRDSVITCWQHSGQPRLCQPVGC